MRNALPVRTLVAIVLTLGLAACSSRSGSSAAVAPSPSTATAATTSRSVPTPARTSQGVAVAPVTSGRTRHPIVLVHGTPGSLFTWAETVCGTQDGSTAAPVAGLAEEHDVYAIDILGQARRYVAAVDLMPVAMPVRQAAGVTRG